MKPKLIACNWSKLQLELNLSSCYVKSLQNDLHTENKLRNNYLQWTWHKTGRDIMKWHLCVKEGPKSILLTIQVTYKPLHLRKQTMNPGGRRYQSHLHGCCPQGVYRVWLATISIEFRLNEKLFLQKQQLLGVFYFRHLQSTYFQREENNMIRVNKF